MVSPPLCCFFLHYSVRGPDHRSHTCSLQHTSFQHTTLLKWNSYSQIVQLRHCGGRQIAWKCQFVSNVALIILQTTFTSTHPIGYLLYWHFFCQNVTYHIYHHMFHDLTLMTRRWMVVVGATGEKACKSHSPQCRGCVSTIVSVKLLGVFFFFFKGTLWQFPSVSVVTKSRK